MCAEAQTELATHKVCVVLRESWTVVTAMAILANIANSFSSECWHRCPLKRNFFIRYGSEHVPTKEDAAWKVKSVCHIVIPINFMPLYVSLLKLFACNLFWFLSFTAFLFALLLSGGSSVCVSLSRSFAFPISST